MIAQRLCPQGKYDRVDKEHKRRYLLGCKQNFKSKVNVEKTHIPSLSTLIESLSI